VFEHPSPSIKFPSSQTSEPYLRFPQVAVQTSGVVRDPPAQFQLASVTQFKHPLPCRVYVKFPSSQFSPVTFFPSPQTGVQVETVLRVPVQLKPVLIKQELEQPSVSIVFPSSHASFPFRMFPHVGVQTSGPTVFPPMQLQFDARTQLTHPEL
jgi:hypothetical protein